MRWTEPSAPEDGDERTIRRFLLFPTLIDDQWRWLEWATIRQTYYHYNSWEDSFQGWDDEEWVNP